jgi:hypothetical protein
MLHFFIFIHEDIIFSPYSPFYTVSSYPLTSHWYRTCFTNCKILAVGRVLFSCKSFAVLSCIKDRKPWENSALDYLPGKNPWLKT